MELTSTRIQVDVRVKTSADLYLPSAIPEEARCELAQYLANNVFTLVPCVSVLVDMINDAYDDPYFRSWLDKYPGNTVLLEKFAADINEDDDYEIIDHDGSTEFIPIDSPS